MTTSTDIKTEKLLIDSLFGSSIRLKKIQEQEIKNIRKLTGDASSRSYYRIESSFEPYVACLDQSLTLLNNVESVEFLATQKILKNESVSVPEIFHVDFKKGYVLQEDLGDITFLKKLSIIKSKEEEKKLYINSIDELIKIQRIDLGNYDNNVFINRAFDEEKLMYEVDFTIKHLIDGLFQLEIDIDRKTKIRKNFEAIIKEIVCEKKVLTHRDYHSRNLMVKNGIIKVIDFQDMRMGLPQYDLVSLLEDCYYKIDSENKVELKEYYFEKALNAGILGSGNNKNKESYLGLYNKMAIQRTFKAIGSFAYIYQVRKDIRYLKYIGYSFEQLKSFLFEDSAYSELRTLLSEVYYEY